MQYMDLWSKGQRALVCRSSGQLGATLYAVDVLQVCSAAHAEGEELRDTPTPSGTQLSVLSRYAFVPTTAMTFNSHAVSCFKCGSV